MDKKQSEDLRRWATQEINSSPRSREELEAKEGKTWDTSELAAEFEVIQFMAPMVYVKRKSDGAIGTVFFQHRPRFYWGFEAEENG